MKLNDLGKDDEPMDPKERTWKAQFTEHPTLAGFAEGPHLKGCDVDSLT